MSLCGGGFVCGQFIDCEVFQGGGELRVGLKRLPEIAVGLLAAVFGRSRYTHQCQRLQVSGRFPETRLEKSDRTLDLAALDQNGRLLVDRTTGRGSGRQHSNEDNGVSNLSHVQYPDVIASRNNTTLLPGGRSVSGVGL